MKRSKANTPPRQEIEELNAGVKSGVKYILTASIISCLYIVNSANAEDTYSTNPFIKEEPQKGMEEQYITRYSTYTYDNSDYSLSPIEYGIRNNVEPQEFAAPTSGKSQDPIEVNKWISVTYKQRSTSKDDGMKTSLNGQGSNKLSDSNLYAVSSDDDKNTNKDKYYRNTKKVAEANDNKFGHFYIHNYSKTVEAKKDENNVGGVSLHLDDNYGEGSITSAVIKDNTSILKIEDESLLEGHKILGGGLYIEKNIKGDKKVRLEADFINNSVALELAKGLSDELAHADGGAIYNAGDVLDEIRNSLFEGNSAQRGGAIFNNRYNLAEKGITGLFINNEAVGNKLANGGAIYNESDSITSSGTLNKRGKIGNITAHFIGNHADASDGAGAGGAIFNNAEIRDITGIFANNEAGGTELSRGGAIFNRSRDVHSDSSSGHDSPYIESIGKIGKIKGYFINNRAHQGGAIANQGIIESIEGYFEGNKGEFKGDHEGYIYGGAISNGEGNFDGHEVETPGQIGDINATFYKNSIRALHESNKQTLGRGGAIGNIKDAQIGNIIGDFIMNSANDNGGAIYNTSTIKDITGDFIANESEEGNGGAIANVYASEDTFEGSAETFVDHGKLGTLKSNFYNNTAGKNGGAIYNQYHIDGISAKEGEDKTYFIENKAGKGSGGAIANSGEINGDINADFYYNTAGLDGGAIANKFVDREITPEEGGGTITIGKMGSFTSNFIYNKAGRNGGALYNTSATALGTIEGDFAYNEAGTNGGAIYNKFTDDTNPEDTSSTSEIGNITGDFYANTAKSGNGGAVYNEGNLGNITSEFFAQNSAGSNGGVIYNGKDSVIKDIKGAFQNNSSNNQGGAVYNEGTLGNITSELFAQNSAGSDGGVIYNGTDSKIGEIKGNFIGNTASTGNGGAVYNEGKMGIFTNTNFLNNKAAEHGGAIYTTKDITIVANGQDIAFSGNTAGGVAEAIYVADSGANVTMKATGSENYVLDDQINGVYDTDNKKGYGLKLEGNGGNLYLNNNIINADIEYSGFNTDITHANYLTNNNALNVKSGTVNFGDFGLTQLNFRKFTFADGKININHADVDLGNQVMGRITADEYGDIGAGTTTLKDLTVLTDGTNYTTPVLFADSSFADGVNIETTEAMGPIYTYAVSYSNDGTYGPKTRAGSGVSDGYAVFKRTGYNPAAHVPSVAQLAGGYASMIQTFEYAFEHADTFSALPASVRSAKLNSNKYAITEGSLPSYYNELNRKGLWFRPYTSFENIPLKNGPDVNTVLYGSFAGGDSEIIPLKNGWNTVYTGYVGYNGSHQSYQGNSTYQNGIALGVTDTLYKGDFYTALTMSVGSSIGETSTMFGQDNFTMLMGGVASKTGYNFEFNDGRFIIQPNLLLSYTFLNTFDYSNAAGVRIDAEPLHAIQVHPYVKFIQNTESGWQPYLAGGFVYNIMGQTEVKAIEDVNVFSLPSLSIKPYAEYGLGVQKLWNDKYTGFLQAMIRNGGRDGIAFTMGFRWALGDEDNTEKVKTPDENIKTVSNVTKTEKPAKVKAEKPAKVKAEKPEKVKVEKPKKVKIEKPKKVETKKTAVPVKTQQAENEEHHSFIYNWMLKFSNFFCQPSAPKTAKK